MRFFFPTAVCMCVTTAALQGAIYHVATTGSDSNPGTAAQPFQTVTKGVNTAQPGDTVLVGAGTYSENVLSARGGTNGAMITVDGQGVAQVQSFLLRHPLLQLKNLTIAGSTTSPLIYMDRNADHCVISNNIIDAQYTPGLRLMSWNGPDTKPFGDAGSDNLVVSNTFKHGKGEGGGMTAFGDRNVIRGNMFRDSDTVDWLRVWGRTNIVAQNTFSNHFESGTVEGHADFYQVFGPTYGAQGIIIEQNTIIKMGGSAQLCMISAADLLELRDITFRNNLFIEVARKANIVARDVRWQNNTFYRCSAGDSTVLSFVVSTNATYSSFVANAGHGGQVLNNVFLDCGPPTNSSIALNKLGWYIFDKRLTNVLADYNFVAKNNYQPVAPDTEQRLIGDPAKGNWMGWWEPHGINGGNPLFVDESQLNFRLQERSPLVGAALPLNKFFTTDMRGTTRGTQWDIGALEFQAGDTVSRPIPPPNLYVR